MTGTGEAPRGRCTVALLVVTTLVACLTTGAARAAVDRETVLGYLVHGTVSFRHGDLVAATQDWSQAIAICRVIGAVDLEVQALTRRGEAYRAEGYFREAGTDLKQALTKSEQSGDRALIAASAGALGNLYFLSRRSGAAEPLLRRSHDLAGSGQDPTLLAAAANDLGNLYAASNRFGEAASAYAEAIAAADRAGDETLSAVAATNAARLEFRRGAATTATEDLTRAIERLQRAPASYATGLAFVSAGTAVFDAAGTLPHDARNSATAAFIRAEEIARLTRNPGLTSLALGSLGRLQEKSGNLEEAVSLTERALFAAQQTAAPELLFRWEWQAGRLAHRGGRDEVALADYRRAIADLQQVRQDIPVEYRSGKSSYLATYGPVYTEFADLLLRHARGEPSRSAGLIREARDTVEELKESELQDYFRDSCIASFEAKRRSIDEVAPGTAVLYPIVLPDRLELLVSFGRQQRQFTIALPEAELRREVEQFRLLLEKRTTNEYLPLAQTMYSQIIRPIEPLLADNQIDTLVIVPDNALRLVPFGALHDGAHFLIERYATAIAPSLHLTDPKPLTGEARNALAAGLSRAVQGFSALPHVAQEVADVHEINGGKTLLDDQFRRGRFEGELKNVAYNIVHIASHGEFGSDPSKTFVLAADGRLTMDDLERVIKFGQLRESALELLMLDACETAAGDDRSALGLAGVALKSGARSAVATLWFISDRASGELAVRFYESLKSSTQTKAQALRAAQVQLIADPRFSHPAYWAPFLLVGNWL